MTFISKTSITIAAIGLIACTASANSGEALQPLIKKISYADLNLETSEGAKTLYARLRHAAEDVCSPLESRDLDRKNLWETCYRNALTSAVTQVNKIALTTLHRKDGQSGKS